MTGSAHTDWDWRPPARGLVIASSAACAPAAFDHATRARGDSGHSGETATQVCRLRRREVRGDRAAAVVERCEWSVAVAVELDVNGPRRVATEGCPMVGIDDSYFDIHTSITTVLIPPLLPKPPLRFGHIGWHLAFVIRIGVDQRHAQDGAEDFEDRRACNRRVVAVGDLLLDDVGRPLVHQPILPGSGGSAQPRLTWHGRGRV